ncbi:MAG: hypothetical protein ASUL_07154 [Candidatus Aramenus sulfurataquae]|jgi:hypothetical protein|uniref:DUF5752 family protein n=2 Tax=Candidatus Aramenus sulfurataquae TaxID=1326980 RepID=W7KWC7_9CREN|nr:MAG: hypothetical protein ASUL_07154 [Candidatus Aramenus sulfurataquae]MCL7343577.1 DUF5752 family protein [Candidatus Aramenus sulfurataquae]
MNLDTVGKGISFKFYSAYYPPKYAKLKANSLEELYDKVSIADKHSIFYHVFHPTLSSHAVPEDLPNDFVFWARDSLHDEELADILADLPGAEPLNVEDIRREILEVLKTCGVTNRVGEYPFVFMSFVPVVYYTGVEVKTLAEFLDAVTTVHARSIFYHFVYKRVIGEKTRNDFSDWLESNFGLTALANKLSKLNPQTYAVEEKFRGDLLEVLER